MASDTRTIWGSINANGTIASGSKDPDGRYDFSVTNVEVGVYVIGFPNVFGSVPAIVGSQNRYGGASESSSDGVAFPLVSNTSGTAVTGDGGGKKQNRNFSFIGIGSTIGAET